MRQSLAVALLAWSLIVAAQRLPDALAKDPSRDAQNPAAMLVVNFPSHGDTLEGVLYQASGREPHPTVLLLHGLPGYEQNMDLAQAIRRSGWNVLTFHYRGSWGVAGRFTFAAAMEDTDAALAFLHGDKASEYGIDPRQIVVIGHSMGGRMAAYAGSHGNDLAGVVLIAALNLSVLTTESPAEHETRLQRWRPQTRPLSGVTAEELIASAKPHAEDWDYVRWAPTLAKRPLLIIAADDQNLAQNRALAAATRKEHASNVTFVEMKTDHSFSDHRIALQLVVLRWLNVLRK